MANADIELTQVFPVLEKVGEDLSLDVRFASGVVDELERGEFGERREIRLQHWKERMLVCDVILM